MGAQSLANPEAPRPLTSGCFAVGLGGQVPPYWLCLWAPGLVSVNLPSGAERGAVPAPQFPSVE